MPPKRQTFEEAVGAVNEAVSALSAELDSLEGVADDERGDVFKNDVTPAFDALRGAMQALGTACRRSGSIRDKDM